jgi:hypothetical protein
LSASIQLPDGTTTVSFRAEDNLGLSSSTSVAISVLAPVPNVAPVVSIAGGARTVSDSDVVEGELVVFTATAVDADGTITTTEWLVNGNVVATGLSANIQLPDGTTTVSFRAEDNLGLSSSTSVAISVLAPVPNVAPVVSIAGGARTVSDSDVVEGELVVFTATAVDADGAITTTEWLVNGNVVATGLSANIQLPDGTTTVSFRAEDNLGLSSSTSVAISVLAPVPNVRPVVSILNGDRTIVDTDGSPGEVVMFTASATDSDGTIVSLEWLVNGSVIGTGNNVTFLLEDGESIVTFKATDDDGASSTTTATITVTAAQDAQQFQNSYVPETGVLSLRASLSDGSLVEFQMNQIPSNSDIVFQIAQASVVFLTQVDESFSQFDTSTGVLTIPELIINGEVAARNVRLILTDARLLLFALTSFEK